MSFKDWQIWLSIIAISAVLSEAFIAILPHITGYVIPDDMVIFCLITSVLAASLVAHFLICLRKYHHQEQTQTQALAVAVIRAEGKLKIALENSQLIVWEFDPVKDEIRYNESALKSFDIDEVNAPHTFQTWLAITHPDDRAAFIEPLQRALQSDGEIFDLEYRYKTRSDSWGWAHTRGCLIERDTAGNPTLVVGSTLNITERKRMVDTIQASEERSSHLATMLRLISDNVPDMIWAKDLNKQYLFANRAICNQLLISEDTEEPIGKEDMYFAQRERSRHPEDSQWHTFGELCQDSDAITLKRGATSQFDEFGNVQGKFMFLDVHKAPLVNSKGEVIGVVGSARDITKQRAAQEQLRLASLVLENSSEALLITDADNCIVNINPAFTKLTGYELDEVIGKNPNILHSGRQGQDFYRRMWEEIKVKGRWQGEIWNRRKNGEIYAEWLTINTVIKPDGSVYRRVALFSDITERKNIEDELKRTKERYDFSTMIGKVGTWDWSLITGDLIWSDETYRLMGYQPGSISLTKELFFKLVHPDDWGELNICVQAALNEKKPFARDCRFVLDSSQEIVCNVTGKVEFDDDKPIRMLGTVQNITERRVMQRKVEKQLAFTQAIIDAEMDGLAVSYAIDEPPYQNFTVWNPSMQSITGYTKEEMNQLGWNQSIYLDPEVREFSRLRMDRMRLGEKVEGEQWTITRKDKEERVIEIHSVNVEQDDTHGPVVLDVIRDVTERQQFMQQLHSTAVELEQANALIEEERAQLAERVTERTAQLLFANQAKDSFLASMSHEIRTPLGGLMGMMELLSLSTLDDNQSEMLQVARASGKSLLRIVDDILDWSKIEAGKLILAPRVAALEDMLKGVVNTYAQLASAKGIQLRHEVDGRLSAAHLFDPLRVSQILNNFTSNAIKFTEQGNIVIDAQWVAQQGGSETVRLCVKDSGVGIGLEQQQRLFQHYEQGSADTARMYGGTGLGLSICRSLAELMEGSISVDSEVGIGSTFCFTVTLPVANPAAFRDLQLQLARSDKNENKIDISPLRADASHMAVLVVDDHPINRMLLQQQLEQLGLQVKIAAYGIVALSLWWSEHFDIIITDCHMPEMDGYELTRSIREMEQHEGRSRVPIIAWTANVLAEEEKRCQAAGMDDLLTKPTELADLRMMLLKWLDQTELMPSIVSPPALEQQDPTADSVIDFSALNRISKSHIAQVEMLQEFEQYNRSDIAVLKAELKNSNPQAIAHSAHRIKGACRMVGAVELEALSARIEMAAKHDELDKVLATADKMLDEAVAKLEQAIIKFNGTESVG